MPAAAAAAAAADICSWIGTATPCGAAGADKLIVVLILTEPVERLMALEFDASRPVAVEDALAGCAASYGDAADVVVGGTCLAGAESIIVSFTMAVAVFIEADGVAPGAVLIVRVSTNDTTQGLTIKGRGSRLFFFGILKGAPAGIAQ